jgi:hypothetical protein
LELDPIINGVYWAAGVVAGGNYVRHQQEWVVFPYEKIGNNDGKSGLQRKTDDPISLLKDAVQIWIARQIVNLDIPQKDFFLEATRNISRKITERLQLEDLKGISNNFRSWKISMLEFVKTSIGG